MRRLALFFAAVGLALFAWPASLPADPPEAVGWWWKPQVTPLAPVPTPPTVPDGGLYVAADLSGPFGVSALRYVAPQDSVIGRLTLRVASSQGLVAIRACPTEITWTPEEGGPINSVPLHDCSAASVPGALDADGTTMTFEVGPLVQDGMLNVVLTPQEGPSAFQAAFEKPGPEAVAVSTESSTTEGDSTTAPEYSYLEGPAFTDTGPSFGGNQFSAPTGPAIVPEPPAVTPSTVVRPQSPRRAVQPRLAVEASRDADRVVAALVLVALSGVFMWVAERPERMPRLVGPMGVLAGGAAGRGPVRHAEAQVMPRGVGRFRRARTGRPPPL